jgi:hypothetical protein
VRLTLAACSPRTRSGGRKRASRTAMSLAPLAYLLFQNVLVHDPADGQCLGRNRFVLSAGHTSPTLYIQLLLSGYERVPGGSPPPCGASYTAVWWSAGRVPVRTGRR